MNTKKFAFLKALVAAIADLTLITRETQQQLGDLIVKVNAIENSISQLTRQDTRGRHFSQEFMDEALQVLGLDLSDISFVNIQHFLF